MALETNNGMLADMDSIEDKLNEVIRMNVGMKTYNMSMEKTSDVIKETHLEMYVQYINLVISSFKVYSYVFKVF